MGRGGIFENQLTRIAGLYKQRSVSVYPQEFTHPRQLGSPSAVVSLHCAVWVGGERDYVNIDISKRSVVVDSEVFLWVNYLISLLNNNVHVKRFDLIGCTCVRMGRGK